MKSKDLVTDPNTENSNNENSGVTAELTDEALDDLISNGNVERPWRHG